MEKLAALIPPPRKHLTRFHGIFAPHAKFRHLAIPEKDENDTEKNAGNSACTLSPEINQISKSKRISWARLLSRIFQIDMDHCTYCGGEMKALCAVIEKQAINKILAHLNLSARAPPISASSIAHQEDFYFD